MATLARTVKKIKAFDFERAILNIVSFNDKKALNLNRDIQLFAEGSDAEGNLLQSYHPITIEYKEMVGQPTDRTTLRDTESFHNSFFLDASKFPLRISATDSKTGELMDKYGEDIFGLDDESQAEFNEYILDDIQEALKKAL